MQKQQKRTAGESLSAGAKSALAFARGEKDHGCIVHIPAEIDVKAIRATLEADIAAGAAPKPGGVLPIEFTHMCRNARVFAVGIYRAAKGAK